MGPLERPVDVTFVNLQCYVVRCVSVFCVPGCYSSQCLGLPVRVLSLEKLMPICLDQRMEPYAFSIALVRHPLQERRVGHTQHDHILQGLAIHLVAGILIGLTGGLRIDGFMSRRTRRGEDGGASEVCGSEGCSEDKELLCWCGQRRVARVQHVPHRFLPILE